MSDDQHSDLIRRLHEEGSAKAPDGLQSEVMVQVAAEPRRKPSRPRRLWRPVLAVGAVACALGGAAIGLSSLGGSSTAGGSSSSAAASADAESTLGASAQGSVANVRVYTVPARTAATILGTSSPKQLSRLFDAKTPKSSAGIPSVTVRLPASGGTAVEARLRVAEQRWRQLNAAQSADQRPVRVIVRPPTTTTGP